MPRWLPKLASSVRTEAAELARLVARQRECDGDPEAAEIIADLAAEIARIPLTFNPEE